MIFLHVNGTYPGFTKSDKEKDYPRLGKRIPVRLAPQPLDQRYNFNPEDRPDLGFILQQAQRLLRTKFGTIDPENTVALT
ncbi:hypothetical protein MAR_019659 [Mya arenaria]|uniref:Uncharacterized protein n=1 Tax=Mya arenaria TaxID=6604 RepID=A0ABY7E359_MYAAR|nr:hypothetical protein MAR_019659 [Mya arenaria]